MKKIKLEIIRLTPSHTSTSAYALVLKEAEGNRRLPIIIGPAEAQAIAVEFESLKPLRPLTHDLFKKFAESFGVSVIEVIINQVVNGVFHSRLVCQDDNNIIEIDSRTSDAVALALRFNCPVYAYESVMDEAGIVVEEESTPEQTEKREAKTRSQKNDFVKFTLKELDEMLQKAVEEEEYERASLIRDEIQKRKKKK